MRKSFEPHITRAARRAYPGRRFADGGAIKAGAKNG